MSALELWGDVAWTGWVALAGWGLGWGLAGLLIGRHLARRHFDQLLEVARLLRLREESKRKARRSDRE